MGFGFFPDDVVAFILGVVDERTGFLIDPIIGDDAVPGRVRAGGQGCMAHGGFGIGVLVMGIRIPGAFLHQVAESPLGEAIGITTGQVPTQLIHGDLQNETGSRGGGQRRGAQCQHRQRCNHGHDFSSTSSFVFLRFSFFQTT